MWNLCVWTLCTWHLSFLIGILGNTQLRIHGVGEQGETREEVASKWCTASVLYILAHHDHHHRNSGRYVALTILNCNRHYHNSIRVHPLKFYSKGHPKRLLSTLKPPPSSGLLDDPIFLKPQVSTVQLGSRDRVPALCNCDGDDDGPSFLPLPLPSL